MPKNSEAQKIVSISESGCYSIFSGDTLRIGNNCFERAYLWNSGNLVSLYWENKKTREVYHFTDTLPDFTLPKEMHEMGSSDIKAEFIKASPKWNAHLAVEVYSVLGKLHVKRLFRIFPGTSAFQCTYFLKGKADSHWVNHYAGATSLDNLEQYSDVSHGFSFAPVLEKIQLPGLSWSIRTVRFYDITDRYNNFCQESEELLYRMNIHKGNLAILRNMETGSRIFILKESPSYYSQLSYPGADFISSIGKIQLIGIGLDSADLKESEWIQAYGFVSGFGGNSEYETLSALRTYQKNIFPGYAASEPIFMTNTWGDRGQDKKLGEAFIMEEIAAAKRLGSNYLQIDDGWEAGLSANSAFKGGTFETIWDREGYWDVHPEKFPRGLKPLLDSASRAGIKLSIWFNPAYKNNYENWQKDAEVLWNLNRNYGFNIIKIDGLKLENKISEDRVRKLFDYVYDKTGGELSYNLDITAHKRFGYHFFNEYGTYWVSNRYTDWKNYYPHTTLRNLWLLSKYVPPEKLQMPFCNIWRNAENYGDNIFAPGKVTFDYALATVMAAQPMGFFENSGLPEQAFEISKTVQSYLSVQQDFHKGIILPVGEEPSGTSWTGFQSVTSEKTGYFLFFRELNEIATEQIKVWLPEGSRIKLEKIAGVGAETIKCKTEKGSIGISLPGPNSWALYSYTIL